MAQTTAIFRSSTASEATDDAAALVFGQSYPELQAAIIDVPVTGTFIDVNGASAANSTQVIARRPAGSGAGEIAAADPITEAEFLLLDVVEGPSGSGATHLSAAGSVDVVGLRSAANPGNTSTAWSTDGTFTLTEVARYRFDCQLNTSISLAAAGDSGVVGGTLVIGTTAGAADVVTLPFGGIAYGFNDDNRHLDQVVDRSLSEWIDLTPGTYFFRHTTPSAPLGGERTPSRVEIRLSWEGYTITAPLGTLVQDMTSPDPNTVLTTAGLDLFVFYRGPFSDTTDYLQAQIVSEAGNLYEAQNAIAASATLPSTDPTNWTRLTNTNDVSGDFIGPAANTYAGLPATKADGSPIDNADWTVLTDDDIGTGSSSAPQFRAGGYFWNLLNTEWGFGFPIGSGAVYNVTNTGGTITLGNGPVGQWVQIVIPPPNGEFLSAVTVPVGAEWRIINKYEGVALVKATESIEASGTFAASSLTHIDYDMGSITAWARTTEPNDAYGKMWGDVTNRTYDAAANPKYATFLGMIQSGEIPAGVATDNGDDTFTLENWSGVYLGAAYGTKIPGEFEDYLTALPRTSAFTTNGAGGGTADRSFLNGAAAAGLSYSSGAANGNHGHSIGGGDGRTQPPTRFARWVVKLVGTPTELATGSTLNITQDITQVPYDVTLNGSAIAAKAVAESTRSFLLPLTDATVEVDTITATGIVAGSLNLQHRGNEGLAEVALQSDGSGTVDIVLTERPARVSVLFNGSAAAGTTIERGKASVVQVPLTNAATELSSTGVDATNAIGAAASDRVRVLNSGIGGFAYIYLEPDGVGPVDVTFTEQAISLNVDTFQHFVGEHTTTATTPYTFSWTPKAPFVSGTSITLSTDGRTLTFAEGFTYEGFLVNTHGQDNGFSNASIITSDGSDDGQTYAGGGTHFSAGGVRPFELQVPTGGGSKTIRVTGRHIGKAANWRIIVKAVAKDNQTTLPEVFPRHEIQHNGVSFTPQQYIIQGSSQTVRIPITTPNMGIELTAAAVADDIQMIWHGNGPSSDAIVSIPTALSLGTVDITYTLNDVVEGSRSLNQGGEYRPAAAIDIANNNVTTGLDLRTADYITCSLRDTGTGGRTWPVATLDLTVIREQTNDEFFVWNHSDGYCVFTIVNRETGELRLSDTNRHAVFEACYTESWGFNHYLVPTGYDPLSPQVIMVNGAAPISGSPGFVDRLFPVEFALPAGQQVDQSTVNATNNAFVGTITAGDGTSNGKIDIRPTQAGPIDVTFTTKPAGLGSITRVQQGVYNPNSLFRLGAATGGSTDITTGINFTLCDEIDVAIARNSDGNLSTILTAPCRYQIGDIGNVNAMTWTWADGNRRARGWFKSLGNAQAGIITVNDDVEATGAYWIAGYSNGPVGYQVATGTTAATPVQATITLDGAAATILTPSSTGNVATLHELKPGQIRIQLPADKILLSATPDNPAVIVTPRDIDQAILDYSVPAGTGNFTIDCTTGDRNAYKTLVATADNLGDNGLVPLATGNMGDLFGRMVGGIYQPGQYQALWIEKYEGSVNERSGGTIRDAEEWVRHGYGPIEVADVVGNEYIIFQAVSETHVRWAITNANMPNSDIRVWGIRSNVAIPSNYIAPALRNVSLAAAGNISQLASTATNFDMMEGPGTLITVSMPADHILDPAVIDIPATSGTATLHNPYKGEIFFVPGSADTQITVNSIPRPTETTVSGEMARLLALAKTDRTVPQDSGEFPVENYFARVFYIPQADYGGTAFPIPFGDVVSAAGTGFYSGGADIVPNQNFHIRFTGTQVTLSQASGYNLANGVIVGILYIK